MLRESVSALMLFCVMPSAMCAAEPVAAFRNAAPGVGYIGSKACAGCHKAVYERFIRTSMGRPTAPAAPAGFTLPAKAEIPALHRRFDVFEKDGRIVQSETESADGTTIWTSSQPMAWAIGSG